MGYDDLTKKQEGFAVDYVKYDCKTTAYRKNYNCENTADKTVSENACRLAKNSKVAAKIERLRAKLSHKFDITPEKVLQQIAKHAFLDPQELVDEYDNPLKLSELPKHVAAAVRRVKTAVSRDINGNISSVILEYRLSDPLPALDKLARKLGLFKEDNKQRSSEETLKAILNTADGATRGLPSDSS